MYVSGPKARGHDEATRLIELVQKRHEQLECSVKPKIEDLQDQLRQLGLGAEAEAFVEARLRLTKHEVRPDVKGGVKGGAPHR